MSALQFKIDLEGMYKSTFGINATIGTNKFLQIFGIPGIETLPDDQSLEFTSALGVPVWDIVSLEGKIEEGTGKRFEGYTFPAEMTIEAFRPKKRVETDIVGLEGEVEELVSPDDWQLTARGFIINYEGTAYPELAVKALKNACDLMDSTIPVLSKYLNLLDIYYVSIHELRLPQLEGYSNVQPFEISMKSKQPFIIAIGDGTVL